MDAVSTLTGTITVTGKKKTFVTTEGIRAVSLKYISGVVTYEGSETLRMDDGTMLSSSAEALDASGFELVGENPLNGFIVDATGGSVRIVFLRG